MKLKQSKGTFWIQYTDEHDVKKCVGALADPPFANKRWADLPVARAGFRRQTSIRYDPPPRSRLPSVSACVTHSTKGNVVFRFLIHGSVLMLLAAPVAASAAPWFAVLGDPGEKNGELIEVLPAPTALGERVLLDLRVSRSHQRTSFRGQKYRSYVAKVSVDCTAQKAWYLWLSYHAGPQWQGPTIGKENYEEGQAPVLFKDVPGQPYMRLIKAACKARPATH